MAKKKAPKKKRDHVEPAMKLALEHHETVKIKKAAWDTAKETTRSLKAAYDAAQQELDDYLDEIDSGQGVLPLE